MPHFSLVVTQAKAAEQAVKSMAAFAWRPSVDRAARFLEVCQKAESCAKAFDADLEKTRSAAVKGFDNKELLLLSRALDRLALAGKSVVKEMTLFQVPS